MKGGTEGEEGGGRERREGRRERERRLGGRKGGAWLGLTCVCVRI